MISYFQDYITVGVVLSVGIALMVLVTSLAAVLRPNNPTREKLTTYESGVDPVGTGWSQTYIRYYVFGIWYVVLGIWY